MKGSSVLLGALSALLAIHETIALAYPTPEVQHPLQPGLEGHGASKGRPNIVFILTDDQDLQLDSLEYTPLILKHLKEQGTFYRNHFVTTALCCPSRVSLWTGRHAHNTNVTDVKPPYGEEYLKDARFIACR